MLDNIPRKFLYPLLGVLFINLIYLGYDFAQEYDKKQTALNALPEPVKLTVNRNSDKQKISVALNFYKLIHKDSVGPKSLEELTPKLLKKVPFDPFTKKPYSFRIDGKNIYVGEEGDKIENAIKAEADPSYKSNLPPVITPQQTPTDLESLKSFTVSQSYGSYTLNCNIKNNKFNFCNFIFEGLEPPQPTQEEAIKNTPKAPWLVKYETGDFAIEPGESNSKAKMYLEYLGKRDKRIPEVLKKISLEPSTNLYTLQIESFLEPKANSTFAGDQMQLSSTSDGNYQFFARFSMQFATDLVTQ